MSQDGSVIESALGGSRVRLGSRALVTDPAGGYRYEMVEDTL